MKILSILLIGIASLGVVYELKSDKELMESIHRYIVIAIFYIWGYLAQRYGELKYKGGIRSILGVLIFGLAIIGLTSSFFGVQSKYSFAERGLEITLLLAVIFSVSVYLIASGHKRHVKYISEKNNI